MNQVYSINVTISEALIFVTIAITFLAAGVWIGGRAFLQGARFALDLKDRGYIINKIPHPRVNKKNPKLAKLDFLDKLTLHENTDTEENDPEPYNTEKITAEVE